MATTSNRGLVALTIAAASYLLATFVALDSPGEWVDPRNMRNAAIAAGEHRNERSTPRSFVLPRTPAVALEQERQYAFANKESPDRLCMVLLRDLGYSFDHYDESPFNAKVVEAIFTFQKSHGLETTGHLDVATRTLLKC